MRFKTAKYIFTFFFLANCNIIFQPLTAEMAVPEGPPEYRAGWHDGCSSALSIGGFASAAFHKKTFGDGVYQHDPVYQTAWGNGWFSCITQAGQYKGLPGMATAPLE